jgi:hypothetical protein
VRQIRQNLPFRHEALAELRIFHSGRQELNGCALGKLAIYTFGEMNGTHPAASQEAAQLVRPAPDVLPFDSRYGRARHSANVPRERRVGAQIERQQGFHLPPRDRIHTVLGEISGASIGRKIRHLIEEFLDVNSHFVIDPRPAGAFQRLAKGFREVHVSRCCLGELPLVEIAAATDLLIVL